MSDLTRVTKKRSALKDPTWWSSTVANAVTVNVAGLLTNASQLLKGTKKQNLYKELEELYLTAFNACLSEYGIEVEIPKVYLKYSEEKKTTRFGKFAYSIY